MGAQLKSIHCLHLAKDSGGAHFLDKSHSLPAILSTVVRHVSLGPVISPMTPLHAYTTLESPSQMGGDILAEVELVRSSVCASCLFVCSK